MMRITANVKSSSPLVYSRLDQSTRLSLQENHLGGDLGRNYESSWTLRPQQPSRRKYPVQLNIRPAFIFYPPCLARAQNLISNLISSPSSKFGILPPRQPSSHSSQFDSSCLIFSEIVTPTLGIGVFQRFPTSTLELARTLASQKL